MGPRAPLRFCQGLRRGAASRPPAQAPPSEQCAPRAGALAHIFYPKQLRNQFPRLAKSAGGGAGLVPSLLRRRWPFRLAARAVGAPAREVAGESAVQTAVCVSQGGREPHASL